MQAITLLMAIGLVAASTAVAAEQKDLENLALRVKAHVSPVYNGDDSTSPPDAVLGKSERVRRAAHCV